MTTRALPIASRRPGAWATVALPTAVSLLLLAILAAFAQFGVLKTLVVPADAAATTHNITASPGLFQAAIVAFVVVAILDVVVAAGFYLLLRPVNERLARVVGSLRILYVVGLVVALVNLFDVVRLVEGATATGLPSATLVARVGASVAAFDTGWHLALGVFGLHLVGLGALLLRFGTPRLLAALVVLAGIGYLADAVGTALIAGYALTISSVTFVGEALLILWLFSRVARASRSTAAAVVTPDRASAGAAS